MSEGRRERVKERLRATGINGMAPHEILEFMLYPFVPRKDTVPIARALLSEFGNLNNVFHADEEALLRVTGMPKLAAVIFPRFRSVLARAEQESIFAEKRLDSSQAAQKYLISAIGNETVEKVYIVLLTRKYRLISVKEICTGTPGSSEVDVRKIVIAALNAQAGGMILAHNHPSGDLIPSDDDVTATKKLIEALAPLGLFLCDHIIIGKRKAFSMAAQGYMDGGVRREMRISEQNDVGYQELPEVAEASIVDCAGLPNETIADTDEE